MTDNATLSFFSETDPVSTASDSILCPTRGIIRRITIAWPSGCNFLVEVLFRVKTFQVVPTPATGGEEGIRFNAWTEQITPDYPISLNDRIEMFTINHDTVNSHKISAVMYIEGLTESEIENIRPQSKICCNPKREV